jgi:hypothetical protein
VRAFCRSLRDPFLKVGGSTVLVGCSSVLYRLWGARIVSPTTATFAGLGQALVAWHVSGTPRRCGTWRWLPSKFMLHPCTRESIDQERLRNFTQSW